MRAETDDPLVQWRERLPDAIAAMERDGMTGPQIRRQLWKEFNSGGFGDMHAFAETDEALARRFPDDVDGQRSGMGGEVGVAGMVMRQARRLGLRT